MRKVKRTMLFASFLGAIEAVVALGDNATVGNVQKMNLHLTRGQVQRVLNQLVGEGYLNVDNVPYGATGKKVYSLSQVCMTNVTILAWKMEKDGVVNA